MELRGQVERQLVVIQGEVSQHLQQPAVLSITSGAFDLGPAFKEVHTAAWPQHSTLCTSED